MARQMDFEAYYKQVVPLVPGLVSAVVRSDTDGARELYQEAQRRCFVAGSRHMTDPMLVWALAGFAAAMVQSYASDVDRNVSEMLTECAVKVMEGDR